MIDCFFNRPDKPIGIDRILADIHSARLQIALVSAWLTDTEIAQAVIGSDVASKYVILNQADLNRDQGTVSKAVRLLQNHDATNRDVTLCVLGSDNFREGVMHHKFILIDSDVVWCGSYNFTFQARNNYETLLRIEDADVVAKFWDEVRTISLAVGRRQIYEQAISRVPEKEAACSRCGTLHLASSLHQYGTHSDLCSKCISIEKDVDNAWAKRSIMPAWDSLELNDLERLKNCGVGSGMKRALQLYERMLSARHLIALQTAIRFTKPIDFSGTEIAIGLAVEGDYPREVLRRYLGLISFDLREMFCAPSMIVMVCDEAPAKYQD